MYIGAYLCVSGLIFLIGLVWLARRNARLAGYSALAWVAVVAALVVFEVFSILAGLVPFRGAGSFNYPGDYLVAGLHGWILALLLPLGLFSPLLVAGWLAARARHTPGSRA